VVPSDGTEAFSEADYEGGLAYLKQVYRAEICTVAGLVAIMGLLRQWRADSWVQESSE
jgi:hypothetical protein